MRDDVAAAYDEWAQSYDGMDNATRDLDGRVLRESLDVRGLDVVEVGAGTGKNTTWLAAHARSVVALDFSAGMLAKARERVTASSVRFVEHDIRNRWPLDDAAADVVTFNLVLEHIAELAPVFAEVARVLRPGGIVYVCELHPYRQLQGGQAQFVADDGRAVLVNAWRHDVADYVNAAIGAGLHVRELREVRDDGGAIPRLLVVRAQPL
jgi:ubiquinone/menaquinone biosynthesis C-methylase UbiE